MDSQEENSQTIKIKLDKGEHLKEYAKELRRWQNEGGTVADLNNIFDETRLPLQKGEVVEVLDGSIIFEDGDYHYMANIKTLPE